MRVGIVVALFAPVGAGCGDDGTPLAPIDGPLDDIDAPGPLCTTPASPTWWTPAPGEARNWDIQLNPPFDTTAVRDMYELELFDLVPAQTTIDYADGDPVTVPAGALAGTIAELHARVPPAIVVCRVATGAIDLDDPDARKFPGFKAAPPDRPDAPEAGSVIGWNTKDPNNPNERYLDIRASERGRWTAVMFKRFELADQIGCDAIEADRVDMFKATPGFTITEADETTFLGKVSDEIHAHELAAGLRNGFNIPLQVQKMAACYDWVLQDRCAEYEDCSKSSPFAAAGKAMFALDIQLPDSDGFGIEPAVACPRYLQSGINGIVKAEELDSSFREGC